MFFGTGFIALILEELICLNSGEVWAAVELGAEGSLGSHRKFRFASGTWE